MSQAIKVEYHQCNRKDIYRYSITQTKLWIKSYNIA